MDEIDDDESQDSREDSQEFPDESQDSGDSNGDMDGVPGAGSGNSDMMPIERSGGGLQQHHVGPGAAISSQNLQSSGMGMNRNHRQTGSGAGGTSNSRYGHQTHGNMPHQIQQNSQPQQPQYGTGSSGASGINNSRAVRGLNQQNYEESKHYQGSNQADQMCGTGSGGGSAVEAGTANNSRRNRRGYRQQNQQPSSGANGGENNIRRKHNNRQSRQGADPTSGGAAMNNGNSQNNVDSSSNNQAQDRGRPQRVSNRGRQQKNNQQQQPNTAGLTLPGQNPVATLQLSQQSSGAQNPNQLMVAPVSLSQEREQYAQQNYNQSMVAGTGTEGLQGTNSNGNQHDVQAVQQVVNNNNQGYMNAPASTQSQYRNPFPPNSQRMQGAAQTHMSQSSQMMPASTASHSGGQNQFNQTAAAQTGLSYPVTGAYQGSSAPHGGGTRQPQQNTGVVPQNSNMMNFESGSTSFIGYQPATSQETPQLNQGQNARQHGRQRLAGGVPFTQMSQVSSPPSNLASQQNPQGVSQNQQEQQMDITMQNRYTNSMSKNQQNDQLLTNAPNSDMSGPGAVGAPPSQLPTGAAISPPANRGNQNMPSSSNNNEMVQQNVSPGSSGPNHQGMVLPSSENEDNLFQQQSISTIPSSLFGAIAEHEQPAAAHAYMGTGSGGDRDPREEILGSSLLASQFEDVIQEPTNVQQIGIAADDGLTPPMRNNDSRKTSGANTPNKDGADTPTTHLSQSFNIQNRVYGHGAGGTTAQDQTEFGSAVTAGLNAHLASQSNNQQYVHNLTANQLFGESTSGPNAGGLSIIDQLSTAAAQSRPGGQPAAAYNTASLFDDFFQPANDTSALRSDQEESQENSGAGASGTGPTVGASGASGSGVINNANVIPNNMFD